MSKPLPPLNSIRAFEVAARHTSFSRAAEEIGVTPGAISKQILALEDYIGVKLFDRLPGGLTLTPAGYSVRSSVEPAFELLSQAFSRYSRRSPRSNICRISTMASFAGQFLVPRLDKFKEELPNIDLEILTSQRLDDFSREEVDLTVRYGQGTWDDVVSTQLIKGQLVPVCSPSLLQDKADKDCHDFILTSRRIQIHSSDEWRAWSQLTQLDLSESRRPFIIEDTLVAMEATLSGQGIALLPEVIARHNIENGKLVTFSDQWLPWNKTYFVTHTSNADRNPVIRDVIAWIKKEVAGS
jgi:LysR family glycine cleavage system transcriptional activator